MKVKSISDVGLVRENNEDCCFVSEKPVGVFESLFMVADGMGGYQGGEIASSVCIHAMLTYIESAPLSTPLDIFSKAVDYANIQVREKAEAMERPGMGTTLVAAGVINGIIYIINVGDSRAYLVDKTDFSIHQITRDHSFVEEQVDKGLLNRNSEEYKKQKNIITRAIGADQKVDADFYNINQREDTFLLLCTDGLTNMVSDLKIKNLILDDCFSLEKRTQSLVDVANENGGKDNITIILIEL